MIQCPRWYARFGNDKHAPRILFGWGHTICENWLNQLINNAVEQDSQDSSDSTETSKVFYWPECNTMHHELPITSFPKNLALLNMTNEKAGSSTEGSRGEHNIMKQDKSPVKTYYDSDEDSNCISHSK